MAAAPTTGGGYLPGYASIVTAAATIDNFNPDPGVWPTGIGCVDIDPSSGLTTIIGMVAGADGQLVFLWNADDTNEIEFQIGASSVPANNFQGVGGGPLILPPQTGTWARYYGGLLNVWRFL